MEKQRVLKTWQKWWQDQNLVFAQTLKKLICVLVISSLTTAIYPASAETNFNITLISGISLTNINNNNQSLASYGYYDVTNASSITSSSENILDLHNINSYSTCYNIVYISNINDNGQLAGTYCNSLTAFIFDIATNEVINLDILPTYSLLFGINNKLQLIGNIFTSGHPFVGYEPEAIYGFTYKDGNIINIDYQYLKPPESCHTILSTKSTTTRGINNNGVIIGYTTDNIYVDDKNSFTSYCNPDNKEVDAYILRGEPNTHGFIYKDGIYSRIDYPGSRHTYLHGINDNNDIVGYYIDTLEKLHGFIYSNGTFINLDLPNNPIPLGINNAGMIVGRCEGLALDCSFVAYSSLQTPAAPYSTKNLGACDECNSSKPSTAAGNPINVATGNKFQTETDFDGTHNTHLVLRRYYNSQDTTYTAFGTNWRGTYNRSISYQSGSTIAKVAHSDGRMDTFNKGIDGTWHSDADVTSQLTAIMNTSYQQTGWQLVTNDDSTELYTLTGQLTSITTRNGLTTTLDYDSNDRLTKVTGPFGHTLNFAYDSSNHIKTVTLPDGQTITYAYDSNNNLISATYPGTAVRQYLYENASFHNALTGIIDENGNRFATYAYDSQGRATSTQHAGGAELTTVTYNSDGTASVTDANGNSYGYAFTTQYDLVKPTAVSNAGCGCGSSDYSYDTNGFLASRTDFNGNITTYVNNARGLETSRTEASGTSLARTIATEWDSTFRLPTKVTEPNRVTTFTYDAKGNLLTKTVTASSLTRTWTYTYNSKGQVLTADGPRTDVSDKTTYAYDMSGNLASITDALGHITRITSYDGAGRPLSIQDPNGLVTTLAYDARGRLTSKTEGAETTAYSYDSAGQLTKITLPDGSFLAYTYDAAHRPTAVADALGNRIAYTLDLVGNIVKEQAFDSSNVLAQTRSHVYDSLNRLAKDIGAQSQTTAYSYDNNGNLTSTTDPLGNATSNAYDALNRLIKATDPNNGAIAYGYDANDQLTSVTDPRSLATSYTYDGLDDRTKVQSPDTGATANTYDAAGNILTSTDARGKKTTYAYDALNRLTKTTFTDSTSITWQYDQGANGIGRLTKMTDSSGSTAWSYDAHGRVTKNQQQTGSVTLSQTYAYDSSGRLTSVTYPSGKTLAYSYDSAGRISAISVDGNALVRSVKYQPFGAVASWIQGAGSSLSYTRAFDQDGRIAEIMVKGASGEENAVIDLSYDAANHITNITDSKANLPSLESESTGLQYASTSNRLTQTTGSAAQSYSYDAAGNTISDGVQSFAYNARGRLQQSTSGGVTTQYALNGLGQRVSKSGSGVSTGVVYFVYDADGHLVGEYNASGNVVQETVWLGDLPVGVLKSSGRYFVNPDHLGSPRSITDQTGKAVWTWDSDPFGKGAPNESPSGGAAFTYNLRLPGQYYDSETGLHYNYYRDYAPNLGRYIQSDPIGLVGGVNMYAYVRSSPANHFDRWGLESVPFDISPLYAQALAIEQNISHYERLGNEAAERVIKHNLHEFMESTSDIAGLSAGFAAATPVTAPLVIPFGGISACSEITAYLLEPTPVETSMSLIIDISTASLLHNIPTLEPIANYTIKQSIPYIANKIKHE